MDAQPAAATATQTNTAAEKAAKRHLRVGDKVRLRSGSEKLCVTAVGQGGSIRCAWFSNNQKLHRAAFPERALVFQPVEIWDSKRRKYVIVPDADDDGA